MRVGFTYADTYSRLPVKVVYAEFYLLSKPHYFNYRAKESAVSNLTFYAGDTIVICAVAKDMFPAFDTMVVSADTLEMQHTVFFTPLKKRGAFILPGVDVDFGYYDKTKGERSLINIGTSGTDALLYYFVQANPKTHLGLSHFYPDSTGKLSYHAMGTSRLYGGYFNLSVPIRRLKKLPMKKLPEAVARQNVGTKGVAFITILRP